MSEQFVGKADRELAVATAKLRRTEGERGLEPKVRRWNSSSLYSSSICLCLFFPLPFHIPFTFCRKELDSPMSAVKYGAAHGQA